MSGMNRQTGARIDGVDHIAQSVADILSTRRGERVMRRDYGSDLPDLIDAPVNRATRQLMAAASATAIARWEPRISVTKFGFAVDGATGAVSLTVEGRRTDVPSSLSFSIPL